MSAEAVAEAVAEASIAGGAISMNHPGADIFSGAGVDAGARIAVQRGDRDKQGVFGGDKHAGSAGEADCDAEGVGVQDNIQEVQELQWETSLPIAL